MSTKRLRSWLQLVLLSLLPLSCTGDGGPAGILEPEPQLSRQDHGEDHAAACRSADEEERDDRKDRQGRADWNRLPTRILARYEGRAPVTPDRASERIGPEGGRVRLGDFEIVVPPGAVSRPTTFFIRRPVDRRNRQKILAELGPHGCTFEAPVIVRFPYSGTTLEGEDDGTVVTWDKRARGWRAVPSRVVEGGARIEAEVGHLSYWGTSRYGDADLTSGGR